MCIRDRLKDLQHWILGDLFDMRTILFYVTTGLFCFFASSASRLSAARFPCLSTLLFNYLNERVFINWILNTMECLDIIQHSYALRISTYEFSRYFCVILILRLLCVSYKEYKDYDPMIYSEVHQLKKWLKVRLNTPYLRHLMHKVRSPSQSTTRLSLFSDHDEGQIDYSHTDEISEMKCVKYPHYLRSPWNDGENDSSYYPSAFRSSTSIEQNGHQWMFNFIMQSMTQARDLRECTNLIVQPFRKRV
eukprot:TRINITY_DN11201_c0_g1_i3.p1 TRINITY_DN11201_c0_g1~~TRINITY_DN11201_c0_g1_i3.p1  ORF type:complete len:248 (+),score=-17.19 TRINITY_DN11201_c0_g1_i3:65-808(+)